MLGVQSEFRSRRRTEALPLGFGGAGFRKEPATRRFLHGRNPYMTPGKACVGRPAPQNKWHPLEAAANSGTFDGCRALRWNSVRPRKPTLSSLALAVPAAGKEAARDCSLHGKNPYMAPRRAFARGPALQNEWRPLGAATHIGEAYGFGRSVGIIVMQASRGCASWVVRCRLWARSRHGIAPCMVRIPIRLPQRLCRASSSPK